MSDLDQLTEQHASAITAALAAAGHADATVTITGAASVGATRTTLFLDIEFDGRQVLCVAQIGSTITSGQRVGAADEAELLQLASDAGVPVPRVVAVATSPAEVLITTRIDGLSVPRHILRSLDGDIRGDRLAEQCGAALAKLHSVSIDRVPASIQHLDPADPHRDYCKWLAESLDELPTHHPAVRWGINHLRRHPPSRPDKPALVHADVRNGNILVDDGRLMAVLDWELTHVGDPMEDLAWMCVRMWRFGNDDRPVGGFGSVEALRRGYEAAGGHWRDDAFRWWLAARSAWWAIGLARQAAAFVSGESTSIVHAASGRRVAELEYDLMTLIRGDRAHGR